MITLTAEDKAILAHGIVEVDAWIARTNGSEFEDQIAYQLELNRADYLAKKDLPGYQTAAQKAL